MIIGQRLRKGAANSARGAKKFVTEALGTLKRTGVAGKVLCRFDSAYYGHRAVSAALAGGADVSVTARMNPAHQRRHRHHRRGCMSADPVHERRL